MRLTTDVLSISKIQVMLYDIAGRLVYRSGSENVQKGINTIQLRTGSNLTAGIYTLVVINTGNKTTKTFKLIKQ